MFVPVPIVIVLGLIFFLMVAQIVRGSRYPLLADQSGPFGPAPMPRRQQSPLMLLSTLPPEVEPEVRALLKTGHKIEAIKLARDLTRLGLKEVKDLVAALE